MTTPLQNKAHSPSELYSALLKIKIPSRELKSEAEKRQWLENVIHLILPYRPQELQAISSATLKAQMLRPFFCLRARVKEIGKEQDIALFNKVAACFNQCIVEGESSLPPLKCKRNSLGLGRCILFKIGAAIGRIVKLIRRIWHSFCQMCLGRRKKYLSPAKRSELHKLIRSTIATSTGLNSSLPRAAERPNGSPLPRLSSLNRSGNRSLEIGNQNQGRLFLPSSTRSNSTLSASFGVPLNKAGELFAQVGIELLQSYIHRALQSWHWMEGNVKKPEEVQAQIDWLLTKGNSLVSWIVNASLSGGNFIQQLEEHHIVSSGEVQHFIQRALNFWRENIGKENIIKKLQDKGVDTQDPDLNSLLDWLCAENKESFYTFIHAEGLSEVNLARYEKMAEVLFKNLVMDQVETLLKKVAELVLHADTLLENFALQNQSLFVPQIIQALENLVLKEGYRELNYALVEKFYSHSQMLVKMRQEGRALLDAGKNSGEADLAQLNDEAIYSQALIIKSRHQWARLNEKVSPSHESVQKLLKRQELRREQGKEGYEETSLNHCLAETVLDQFVEDVLSLIFPGRATAQQPRQQISYGFEKLWRAAFIPSELKQVASELDSLIHYFIPSELEENFKQSKNFAFKEGPSYFSSYILMPLVDSYLKKAIRQGLEQLLLQLCQKDKINQMIVERVIPKSIEAMMQSLLEAEFDSRLESLIQEMAAAQVRYGDSLEYVAQLNRLAQEIFERRHQLVPFQILKEDNWLDARLISQQRLLAHTQALVASLDQSLKLMQRDAVPPENRAASYREAKAEPSIKDRAFSSLFTQMIHLLLSEVGQIAGSSALKYIAAPFIGIAEAKIGEAIANSTYPYTHSPKVILSKIGQAVEKMATVELVKNLFHYPQNERSVDASDASEASNAVDAVNGGGDLPVIEEEAVDYEQKRRFLFKKFARFTGSFVKYQAANKLPALGGIRDQVVNSLVDAEGKNIEQILNKNFNEFFSDEVLNFDRIVCLIDLILSHVKGPAAL